MAVDQITRGTPVLIKVDHHLVSTDAMIKVFYWLSREFVCEVVTKSDTESVVSLVAREPADWDAAEIDDLFKTRCFDFALREQLSAKTSEVRDLLLAKAFAESGVLEDQPSGTFGDSIEEARPDGMFRILSNGI